MDFFEYAELVQRLPNNELWVSYLVGGLCFAIVFIFSAVALFTIASREGYKHKWMACIPFFNTYYIGVCGQKNKCLGMDARKAAVITAILEFLLVVGFSVYYIGRWMLASGGYIMTTSSYDTVFGGQIYEYAVFDVPSNLEWAKWCFYYLYDYILWWVQLVYVFLEILVLSCFFQTYAARRYFIFTITSVLFPVQGILFFVLRNNRGLNYRDYVIREQEKQYRMYQQYHRQNNNPYNNPYNQNPYNNPYSNGSYNNPPTGNPQGSADDPFAEFGGGNGSGSGGSSNTGGSNDPFDLN